MALQLTSTWTTGLALLALASLMTTSAPARAQDWVYTVVEGDNLWSFSEKHLDSVWRFEDLQRLNNIDEPRRMPPGTLIRVPMSWIPAGTPQPAFIESVAGGATIYATAGGTRPVVAGAQLMLGDRVRTDSNASLSIRFADGSVLTLFEDSEIRMDSLTVLGETGMVDSRLHLVEGRVETSVTPAVGPGSRYDIATPSAISAVRGTAFRVEVDDAQSARFEVVEGRVAVAAQGEQRAVSAGFGAVVESGKAPAEPTRLLPAPARIGFTPQTLQSGTQVRWSSVNSAQRYRVEVAEDVAFTQLVYQATLATTDVALPRLAPGEYRVRVRGIDARGLQGLSGTRLLPVPEDPPPAPVALTVLHNGEQAKVVWRHAPQGAVEIQIAADRRFDRPIASQVQSGGQVSLVPDDRDVQFIRARVVLEDGSTGPWGAVQPIDPLTAESGLSPFLQGLGVAAVFLLLLL